MKKLFLLGAIFLTLLSAPAFGQLDFRYIPGEVTLNLSQEIDLAWIENQNLINTQPEGLPPGVHWKPATPIERKLLNMDDANLCITLEPIMGVCWPGDFPDNMPPKDKEEMLNTICTVFNRNVKSYKDRTVVCGEPKGIDGKSKNQAKMFEGIIEQMELAFKLEKEINKRLGEYNAKSQ